MKKIVILLSITCALLLSVTAIASAASIPYRAHQGYLHVYADGSTIFVPAGMEVVENIVPQKAEHAVSTGDVNVLKAYPDDLKSFRFAGFLKVTSTGEYYIIIKEIGSSKCREVTFRGIRLNEDEYYRTRINEGGVDGYALYYRTAYYNTQPSGLLYAESECKYTTRVLKINAVI